MSAWWVSWYSDISLSEFELHSPWWISGHDSDWVPTVVAAVRAEDENAAREQVLAAYDNPPSDVRWRFIEPLTRDTPFTDRFPQHGWMAWDEHGTCQCPARHARREKNA